MTALSQEEAFARIRLLRSPNIGPVSYGQLLRGGKTTGNFGWKDTLALAKGAKGQDPFGLRAEFVELVETASSLSSRTPPMAVEEPPPALRPLPRPVPVVPIRHPRLPVQPQPY